MRLRSRATGGKPASAVASRALGPFASAPIPRRNHEFARFLTVFATRSKLQNNGIKPPMLVELLYPLRQRYNISFTHSSYSWPNDPPSFAAHPVGALMRTRDCTAITAEYIHGFACES